MRFDAEIRAQSERLFKFFQGAGALPVETDMLQPADTLLDLYGEDIRARAYVTSDPLRGEVMLRPDFTVPVVRMHLDEGADQGRYTYMGKVFRQQEHEQGRPNEYFQVGYEQFGDADREQADADVFALFDEVLSPLGLRAATGDMGILLAAVDGLSTTDKRKAALRRHLWRPRRFRALIDRFGGRSPAPASRQNLLAQVAEQGVDAVLAANGPAIGLRSQAEVAARIEALQEDAAAAALSQTELEILDQILGLRETAPNALEQLRDIAVDMPAIADAVERLEKRLAALGARGVDVDNLDFEASYGRTTMEYYDGFVFGFYNETRLDLPPVASGGRYDALTGVLGQAMPAVGGVVRPAEVLLLTKGGK
ncbi:ATP phosphoribosyltransferase regulatory subunit [Actibacterium atlanticum]|uniref:Histidine--tRNA ligase n=1 Tax=Actibacterium atlanticum TaxID=1461693 RepID=A0A058ZQ05_9RHOB|nr:ATP phosphoribosyltransferase regulatory subunit [Actibacterium atlanticum]KCV82936.1 ATP phosphoribosyltransferase regulatory subunit [Actibacterium atlanticum]